MLNVPLHAPCHDRGTLITWDVANIPRDSERGSNGTLSTSERAHLGTF
jgi:hypothetical protein